MTQLLSFEIYYNQKASMTCGHYSEKRDFVPFDDVMRITVSNHGIADCFLHAPFAKKAE